jgi:predicted  nucleic acid-binding Zn-ribbon protein
MSESFNLFRLQQLDLMRMKILSRQREIEKIINSDSNIQKAQTLVDEAKEHLNIAQQAYTQIHDQVEERNLKLKYSQAKLFGGQITNPKELRDLEAESAALTNYLSELADEQFLALETLEERQKALKVAENNLTDVKSQTATKHSKLMGEARQLEDKLPSINEQRKSLRSQISPANYQAYVDLFKSKGGRAVAEVIDSCCNACGVNLAPGDIQRAKSPSEITYCKTCGRMLYAK